jgi:restriction system protein
MPEAGVQPPAPAAPGRAQGGAVKPRVRKERRAKARRPRGGTTNMPKRWSGLVWLKPAAVTMMGLGALLLLAGWWMPELWRPAYAERRPAAFALLGLGALLMWLHTRREAEQVSRTALSSLTHTTLTPYDFAPVTLPMEDPADATAATALAGTPVPPAQAEDVAGAGVVGAPLAEPTALRPAPPLAWSQGLLRALAWRRFEALCEEILKQDGYVVKTEARDTAAGDYLWLYSRLDLQQAVRIVQCRNWSSEPIGVASVREFLGAMVDAGLKSGALMSCGAFTAEAEALARRHGIMLISGPDLLALIDKRGQRLQDELLAVAADGDYGRPTCRRCGRMMAARPGDDGGLTHWVCEGAPRCPGTLDWSPGPA